jgi:hypothetical protein
MSHKLNLQYIDSDGAVRGPATFAAAGRPPASFGALHFASGDIGTPNFEDDWLHRQAGTA